MGYGKIMVGLVSRLQMLFIEVAKGVSEWYKGQKEAVTGGTMALVYPSTVS